VTQTEIEAAARLRLRERELQLRGLAQGSKAAEIERDWRTWLKALFPAYVTHEFAPFHTEMWDWVWGIEKGSQAQTFVAIWPRAAGKSTNAEMACVALGARGRRKYVLYVCEGQDQADDHVQNIGGMLESPGVGRAYPLLADRLVGKFGQSKGWRRNRLRCASGFTIDALGLDTAARGVKLEEQRPDLIIFDDIDSENDSPVVTEKKIRTITRKLIPAGSSDVAILAVQNLVHRDSIFARLVDKRADFLADRKISGPFPAIKDFEYEIDGSRAVITGGTALWQGMDLPRCQEMIDDMGLAAFLAECQHKVADALQGAVFPEFDPLYHVITQGEFMAFFGAIARDGLGRFRIPETWNVGRGLDWGTTQAHPAVVVWAARPSAREQLRDCAFVFRELVRPHYPPRLDAERYIVSPKRLADAILSAEATHGETERANRMSYMSHEASATKNTFDVDLEDNRLQFVKWKAKQGSGVPQIQNYLQIDRTRPHPFRPHLMGRPRLFLVVADGQGECYRDDLGEWCVRPAIDEGGLARLRWEIPQYHYPKTLAGEEKERVDKKNDDAVDALRGLANKFFPTVSPKTAEELREEALPPTVRQAAVEEKPRGTWEREGAEMARDVALGKWRKQQEQENASPDDPFSGWHQGGSGGPDDAWSSWNEGEQ